MPYHKTSMVVSESRNVAFGSLPSQETLVSAKDSLFFIVWNSLSLSLRKTQCFTTFEMKLKTHLFHIHLC